MIQFSQEIALRDIHVFTSDDLKGSVRTGWKPLAMYQEVLDDGTTVTRFVMGRPETDILEEMTAEVATLNTEKTKVKKLEDDIAMLTDTSVELSTKQNRVDTLNDENEALKLQIIQLKEHFGEDEVAAVIDP
jgi:hypothetical protein